MRLKLINLSYLSKVNPSLSLFECIFELEAEVKRGTNLSRYGLPK